MQELKQYIKELIKKYSIEVWALAFLDQYLGLCPLDLDDPESFEYVKKDITNDILELINNNIDIIWGDE